MNIVLLGDSITDMARTRDVDGEYHSYGNGYAFFLEGELATKYPHEHKIYNRGISGNRIVDLYARIKSDCWNLQPDFISVLIGVNDVWHEIVANNGVDLDRYERFYRMLIDDTKARFPNVKFMLLEPFILEGRETVAYLDKFDQIHAFAKVVKKLAEEKGCTFVPLQARFDELAAKDGAAHYIFDGVHPSVAGAKIIAEEWLKGFAK